MAKKYINRQFNYTGDVQSITIPKGIKEIFVDLYGSKAGNSPEAGYGGRAYGTYVFNEEKEHELFIYVGNNLGYNGGGQGKTINGWHTHGGGATDIRTVKASEGSWYDTSHSSWDSDKSLLSRIAVAGGGGGKGYIGNESRGGAGGGLVGGTSSGYFYASGGTQTEGGNNCLAASGYQVDYGKFGCGGNGILYYPYQGVSGGGGWYGGCAQTTYVYAAGGGSSYIALLKDGNTASGVNSGNGYAIIKYLSYGILFISRGKYYSNNEGEIEEIKDIINSDIFMNLGCDINNNDYIDNLKKLNKFKIRKIKE